MVALRHSDAVAVALVEAIRADDLARLTSLLAEQPGLAAARIERAFVAWHATLAIREVPDLAPDQLGLKLAGYALGGAAFALPRLRTGHLAGCLVAHWLADAVLMLLAHPLGCRLRDLVLPPC
jgi:hypothetical protein